MYMTTIKINTVSKFCLTINLFRYERRLRRHLEAELEAERRDREHEKQLILHNMSSKTKQDEERPEKSGKREEKRAKKVKNMSRSSSSLFKKSAKSS